MIFKQPSKFLSPSKKYYYSYYRTVLYSKFSDQHFQNSYFILKSFQFSIKKFRVFNFNHLKHGIVKKQKRINFPFGYFLFSNSLRIRNICMPFGSMSQINISTYLISCLTCNFGSPSYNLLLVPLFYKEKGGLFKGEIINKKWHQTNSNNLAPLMASLQVPFVSKKTKCTEQCCETQLKSTFFFSKQTFIFQTYHLGRFGAGSKKKKEWPNVLKAFALQSYYGSPYLFSSVSFTTKDIKRAEAMEKSLKWNYLFNMTIQNFIHFSNKTQINTLAKRQRFIRNSLKGILLVNFPEKEKNFLIKNLAAENKIALITQSASLLLKDSRNMDDLLGVDDPIQILFDKVKTCIPCICFINNLDRIGKQRYEQEHQSFHGLNNLISLLIDQNFTHDYLSKTINEKREEDFPIAWTEKKSKARPSLATQTSYFKNIQNSNQTILKYLTWFDQHSNQNQLQPIKPEYPRNTNVSKIFVDDELEASGKKNRPKSPFITNFSNTLEDYGWEASKKKSRFEMLFYRRAPVSYHPAGKSWLQPSFLFKKRFLSHKINKNYDISQEKQLFKPSALLFEYASYIQNRIWDKKLYCVLKKKSLIFSTNYYHRLPVWLSENGYFLKHKISISKIKRLNDFYNNQKRKNLLISPPLETNPLLLQLVFPQTQSTKTPPIVDKNYNIVDPKIDFKNRNRIYSKSLFINSLLQSDSTKIFKNHFKPVSKNGNTYSSVPSQANFWAKDEEKNNSQMFSKHKSFKGIQVWPVGFFQTELRKNPQRKFSFNDLGKISVNKKKISRISANVNQKNITFGASVFSKSLSLSLSQINASTFNDMPVHDNYKHQELKTYDSLSSTAKEQKKNDSLKITETDIIKRTALLKFLQILDGFHTTTGRKKMFSLPNLNMFRLITQINNKSTFKTDSYFNKHSLFMIINKEPGRVFASQKDGYFKWRPTKIGFRHECSEQSKKFITSKRVFTLPKTIKPKSLKFKTNYQHFLSIKNFLISRILKKKPENHRNAIVLNSIQNQNNRWLTKTIRFQKAKQVSSISTYQQKKDFFHYTLQKKTVKSFLFLSQIPKWKLDLKKQSALKRLNLLCVWPSYIEDILGPFNLNDSASYILPEYFQLLGHGPKLKKQGITLIASTNNLPALDAALLRPGRFDSIINFSYSFSFINKSSIIIKHSPSLDSTSSIDSDLASRFQSSPFALTEDKMVETFKKSPISEKKNDDFFKSDWNFFNDSMTKQKNSLFLLEKNTDFLFNHIISISPFSLMNKNIKNQFDSQITVLDIPSQSLPIKTFIDVSIFIQYKLWWNFNNKKLSCFDIPKTGLIQKQATSFSGLEWFKIFQTVNTNSLELTLKSKTAIIKDWTRLFSGILRMIYFNFFQCFVMLKTKFANSKFVIKGFNINNKFIAETSINQNSDFANRVAREILISKAVNWGLPKNLSSFDSLLKTYFLSNKEQAQTQFNSKNQTIKSFKYNFHVEQNNVFLKSNRRLLFSIGDFDYNIYSQKNCNFTLIKTKPWEEKSKSGFFRFSSSQNQTKNITQLQANDLTKNEIIINFDFNTRKKNVFLNSNSKSNYFTQSISVKTAFLDQSGKIWKDNGIATAVKNVNLNNTLLIRYNEIYKLKKIKLKQQSFFNLYSFTQSMPKRWLELTTINKLKRHLKISLYQKNPQNFLTIHDGWLSKFNSDSFHNHASCINFLHGKRWENPKIFNNLYSIALLMPTSSLSLVNKSLKTFENFPITSAPFVSSETKDAEENQQAQPETNNFCSTDQFYLFKKLSTNSSLNITCLKIDPIVMEHTLFQSTPSLFLNKKLTNDFNKKHDRVHKDLQTRVLQKRITISNLENPIKDASLFSSLKENTDSNKFFNYKLSTWQNKISSLHLLQIYNGSPIFCRLKKIPRRIIINHIHDDCQTTYKFKSFNTKTKELEMNNNITLLKNSISDSDLAYMFLSSPFWFKEDKMAETIRKSTNKKKQHSLIETHESFFQSYKMYQLDMSFFLLIFYTVFFEKTQHKKITLNTIKIFMPYRSLTFSHFLLSQTNIYDFSCKNFEILIYNKFKNFLVDL